MDKEAVGMERRAVVTEEMMAAGARSLIDGQENRPGSSWADEALWCYEAMHALAQQPAAQAVASGPVVGYETPAGSLIDVEEAGYLGIDIASCRPLTYAAPQPSAQQAEQPAEDDTPAICDPRYFEDDEQTAEEARGVALVAALEMARDAMKANGLTERELPRVFELINAALLAAPAAAPDTFARAKAIVETWPGWKRAFTLTPYSAPAAAKNGCPCAPEGDGTGNKCPGPDGRLLCDPAPAAAEVQPAFWISATDADFLRTVDQASARITAMRKGKAGRVAVYFEPQAASEPRAEGLDVESIAKAAWDEAWELAFSDGESAGHPLGRSRLNRDSEWGSSEVRAALAAQKKGA